MSTNSTSLNDKPAKKHDKKYLDKPKKIHSPIPIYAIGFVWVLYSLISPLYKLSDFLIVGGISMLVFVILWNLIPTKKAPDIPITDDDIKDDLEAEPLTDVEKTIAEGELYLSAISKFNQQVSTYNPNVSLELKSLENSIKKIFEYIKENPEDASKVRRFTNYYMPTALKLLNTYVDIYSRGVQGENSSTIISNIEGVIHTMAIAFDKQLDKLYADDALDISADITVLEHMLNQEGLTPDDDKSPSSKK